MKGALDVAYFRSPKALPGQTVLYDELIQLKRRGPSDGSFDWHFVPGASPGWFATLSSLVICEQAPKWARCPDGVLGATERSIETRQASKLEAFRKVFPRLGHARRERPGRPALGAL